MIRTIICCVCGASIRSSKFDVIRASEQGWFFTKDGKAYCPVHLPDWIPAWRERRKD